MSLETKSNACPRCGSPIPPEAPQGLCPRCLLAGAASAQDPATLPGRITPPPIEEVRAAFPELEILEVLGVGGMSVVYKVRQPKLDRFAALKILPGALSSDPTFVERFHREARVLARLSHPNIVGVFDFGKHGAFCFLLMEWVDGVSLRQAMQAGRFSPAEALALVPDLCVALQYAHEQGVLHRDIKPENILLDSRGRVKLADFGIAKWMSDPNQPRADFTLTQSGSRLGTPHYMAPEQIESPSRVDHRADIYSLGVVFYELLTGELPLGRFAPPSEKAALDARIDAIVFRALAKEKELRQQSANQVKTEVEGLKSQTAEQGKMDPPRDEMVKPPLPPLPDWAVRTAGGCLIAAALSAVASFSFLFQTGAPVQVFHTGIFLAATSIAILRRSSFWRFVALVLNGFALAVFVVSLFNVLDGATQRFAPGGLNGIQTPFNSSTQSPALMLLGGISSIVFAAAIAALIKLEPVFLQAKRTRGSRFRGRSQKPWVRALLVSVGILLLLRWGYFATAGNASHGGLGLATDGFRWAAFGMILFACASLFSERRRLMHPADDSIRGRHEGIRFWWVLIPLLALLSMLVQRLQTPPPQAPVQIASAVVAAGTADTARTDIHFRVIKRQSSDSNALYQFELTSQKPHTAEVSFRNKSVRYDLGQQPDGNYSGTIQIEYFKELDGARLRVEGKGKSSVSFEERSHGNWDAILAEVKLLQASDMDLRASTKVWIGHFQHEQIQLQLFPVELGSSTKGADVSVTVPQGLPAILPSENASEEAIQWHAAWLRLERLRQMVSAGLVSSEGSEMLQAQRDLAIAEAAFKKDPAVATQARVRYARLMFERAQQMKQQGLITESSLQQTEMEWRQAQAQAESQASKPLSQPVRDIVPSPKP